MAAMQAGVLLGRLPLRPGKNGRRCAAFAGHPAAPARRFAAETLTSGMFRQLARTLLT